MQPSSVANDKNFRPQLHLFLLLLVWVLCIGTFLLYASFVYQSIWRASPWWWVLSTGAIGFSSLTAAWLVVKRFWHRSQQTWAIAIFMFTVWPLVLFACFIWLVVSTANARGDLKLSLPVRTFGFWVSNYFEWEAGYRYPRLTSGKFAELRDSGATPNSEAMVEQMDLHIQAMASLLGEEPPKTKTAWVRGSVFGQTGRAVGAWALCRTKDEFGELQRLDRHEVAHTVITTLASGLQSPPMLLAEGWAQSQSNDDATLISQLRNSQQTGGSFSLQELVSEEFYGRSIRPNYSHGGPLTFYLLQRFGGPKFFELYTEVRRPTFLADAERILGVTWTQLEEDFWKWLWLDSHPLPEGLSPPVVFETKMIEEKWKEIEERVGQYEAKQLIVAPKKTAFRFEMEDGWYNVSIVLEGSDAWIITEYPEELDYSVTYSHRSKDKGEFYLEELPKTGELEGEAQLKPGSITLRSMVHAAQKRLRNGSLRNQYAIDILNPHTYEGQEVEYSIQSIETGQKPGDHWRVQLLEAWTGGDDDWISKDELLLDPLNGFRVIQLTSKFADGDTKVRTHEYGLLNELPVALKTVVEATKADGTVTRTVDSETRALSPEETTQVKSRVDSIVSRSRRQNKTDWIAMLVNPYAVAFGWLALAALVLAIDIVGNRLKFPIPPADAANLGA